MKTILSYSAILNLSTYPIINNLKVSDTYIVTHFIKDQDNSDELQWGNIFGHFVSRARLFIWNNIQY